MEELYTEDGFRENISTLRMEADGSFATSVTIYLPTLRPIPEESYLHPEAKFVNTL
jgi:hypothetical protein